MSNKAINVELVGWKEVQRRLETVAPKLRRKYTRQIMNAAAKPLRQEVKARAKRVKRTGALEKSIASVVRLYQNGSVVFAAVGPDKNYTVVQDGRKLVRTSKLSKEEYRASKGKRIRPVNYAHLVEFGTARSAAKPFLRPAFAAKSAEVERIIANGLEKAMDAIADEMKGSAA